MEQENPALSRKPKVRGTILQTWEREGREGGKEFIVVKKRSFEGIVRILSIQNVRIRIER